MNFFNGKTLFKDLIEYIADPRVYINKGISIEEVVNSLNELLIFDGYQLQEKDQRYKLVNVKPSVKEDTNNALWAIADDMRQRKQDGEFDTFMDAYRWAEKYITQNGRPIKAERLDGAYRKAKSEGKLG